MARRVFVTLDAPGGNITGVFGMRPGPPGPLMESRPNSDAAVVAFEAAQAAANAPQTADERIDQLMAGGPFKGLVETLAANIPGLTVAQLVAGIKTNA